MARKRSQAKKSKKSAKKGKASCLINPLTGRAVKRGTRTWKKIRKMGKNVTSLITY